MNSLTSHDKKDDSGEHFCILAVYSVLTSHFTTHLHFLLQPEFFYSVHDGERAGGLPILHVIKNTGRILEMLIRSPLKLK